MSRAQLLPQAPPLEELVKNRVSASRECLSTRREDVLRFRLNGQIALILCFGAPVLFAPPGDKLSMLLVSDPCDICFVRRVAPKD